MGEAARYPLLSTSRWVVPLAIALGLVGAATGYAERARWALGGGAAVIAALAIAARVRRPELVVDDEGYRVEQVGRVKLSVTWSEVIRVKAVPAEQAMYVDCGDPARNLLLPPRRGWGFRFAQQAALYVQLAGHLKEKIEVVESLG
jgi:uncharacterized membrane protein